MAFAFFPEEGIWFALLLASILTPTDAALGLPIFNNPKIPVRIRRTLNVESGLNDGIVTPFVTLFLTLALVEGNEPVEPFLLLAIAEIASALVVAVVVGLAGGKLFALAAERKWSPLATQQMGGMALALAAYSGSVALGGNGFIAAFVAGLLFARMARNHAHELVEFTEISGTALSVFVWTMFGASIVAPAPATVRRTSVCVRDPGLDAYAHECRRNSHDGLVWPPRAGLGGIHTDRT